MSKVPLYQNKNNKSFSPNIRIWLHSVLQLSQLFNKNCCKGAAIFGVPLLWLCTTAVTHIIITIITIITLCMKLSRFCHTNSRQLFCNCPRSRPLFWRETRRDVLSFCCYFKMAENSSQSVCSAGRKYCSLNKDRDY